VRRRLIFAVPPLVLVVGGALFLGTQGAVDTFGSGYPPTAGRPASAPDWTGPCWRRPPRSDRRLLERCARVQGRVVWVQSDGPRDVHLAVLARWRVITVRVPAWADAPGALDGVTAVGPLVRDRTGLEEVDAVAIE
jgi:hypothetical protein